MGQRNVLLFPNEEPVQGSARRNFRDYPTITYGIDVDGSIQSRLQKV